ncbi:peptidase S8, partial [Pseudomonas sp. FW305-BF6]|uniref:S8 family serine peptidase n=1 Tax=Pseudomonas sp. FW305-BF6 TaxID=2070673 RepID=UPI000CBADF72
TGVPHPEKAPDIVNNSWGGGSGLEEFYRPMVQSWRAADIFPVFSAGNTGPTGTVSTPANYPESFAVAATDANDQLARFSSRGPGPFKDVLKPDISAPGVSVRSSLNNGTYGTMNGTSMAAPHVSGVIALLEQVAPQMTIDQIEQVLKSTAKPMTDNTYPTSPNLGYGHGIVDGAKAIKSYKDGLGTV